MGSAGHDNTYFSRELDGAIDRRDLAAIRLYASSLPHLGLATKIRILDVIRDVRPDLFDRAAGKLVREYVADREPGLVEIAKLVDALDPILFSRDELLGMVDRRAT